jgi:hypothetical protein
VTPRELQLALVRGLDEHDKARLQPALEALRAAVVEHNQKRQSLYEHYMTFPGPATQADLARHPRFATVEDCVRQRLGQKREL